MSRSVPREPADSDRWSPRHLVLGVGAFLIVGGTSVFARAQNQEPRERSIDDKEQALKEDMQKSLLKSAKMPRSRGFTLIEVIVVIAILSILAALLFPVLNRSRREGKRMTCLANLSQMAKAVMLYAVDNEDRIPYASSRHAKRIRMSEGFPFVDELPVSPDVEDTLKLYGTSAETWRCPEDTISRLFRDGTDRKATWFDEDGTSYSYNDFLGLSGTALGSVDQPSSIPLFCDIERFHGPQPRIPISIGSRVQCTFLDGHAKSVSGEEQRDFIIANEFWF